MPRKGPAPKRPLVRDPVYGSPLVTQLINKVLVDGKKSTAERIVYGALEGARAKSGRRPRSSPQEGHGERQAFPRGPLTPRWRRHLPGSGPGQAGPLHRPRPALAGWLLEGPPRKDHDERLQNEILDASNGLGAAVKRREDTHKMAESNKAFAHYRW